MRRCVAVVITLFVAASTLLLSAPAQADAPLPVPYQFLPAAIAGGVPGSSAPGTNDWTCKPTRRHPRPVVLVHGTFGNRSTNWQTYGPLLKNNGYCVFALTYGVAPGTPFPADQFGGLDSMTRSAKQLKRFVNKVLRTTRARKVDLVGHSQGTLMPNHYVKFLGGKKKVRNYVSLAPLWHGTGAANPGGFGAGMFAASGVPGCAACTQMGTGSDFMKKMRRGRVAVKGVRYTNIVTKYDELVLPYTSGIQKGMRNFVLQDLCAQDYSEHFQIAADINATQIVLNSLDRRRPQTVNCQPVAPFIGGLY